MPESERSADVWGASKATKRRAEIEESWRRSRLSGVDRGGVGPVEGRIDADWRVSRTAIPVLESRAEMLIGGNASLLLSAPDGTMLWRWDENSSLQRLLDRNSAVVGTRWSEDVIGTNGLGTALETAKPITVRGDEHYCESLHPFVCAGAPIRHPITRRLTGVLSVTSLVKDASPLMGPTLLRLVQDVEEELYSDSSQHEREMLQHFLAERRRLRSAVVAVSAEVFIANAAASALRLDRPELWRCIEDDPHALVGRSLDDGFIVSSVRPIRRGNEVVGAVVVAGNKQPDRVTVAVGGLPERRADLMPEAERLLRTHGRAVIAGESGVGKRMLAHAVLARAAAESVRELDAGAVREIGASAWLAQCRAALESADPVVIVRIDLLDEPVARQLAGILDGRNTAAGPVVVTTTTDAGEAAGPRTLLDRFPPEPVEIPPLRRRPADVRAELERRHLGGARLTAAASAHLVQYDWPGNDRQLSQVRRWLDACDRALVDVADLPAGLGQRISGHLSTIQRAEADAIREALRECAGNKSVAAATLGISRSSLYRKMREYHLV